MPFSASSLLAEIRAAKRVYLIGNGGSYANAVHVCNDLLACGVRAFVLDPATLTATANDYGYEDVFKRWVGTVGESGDLLLAFSGSGRSPNILAAVNEARRIGMKTYLVTDYLHSMDMQQSEENQLVLGHEIMRQLRRLRDGK